MSNVVIGFDPGFGNIKAAMINGSMKTVAFPSVVGVGATTMGMLDEEWGRAGVPDEVRFGGHHYLVGEYVGDYARPIERMDWQRLASGLEAQAFFLNALHGLLSGEDGHQSGLIASVMVGLPVEVMSDRPLAGRIRDELRRWMEGQHVFQVNHTSHDITVNRVEVMPQPLGGFFCWGMNGLGKWERSKGSLKEMTAICDIGMNTIDLFVVRGGQVQRRFVGGETLGMRRAAEVIRDNIRQEHGVTLSLHEADAIMQEEEPSISTWRGDTDLTALVEQAKSTAASGVLQFLESQWGDGRRFRHILFVGGGAEALRSSLVRAYPHGVVIKDAVVANATGFAKYGARVFRGQ